MSFDPMAAAVDWLDAYRAGDINSLLGMYADDAVLHCGCDGDDVIGGRAGLQAYWADRLQRYPAIELHALKPSGESVALAYTTPRGVVHARISFDRNGLISTFVCGPEQ